MRPECGIHWEGMSTAVCGKQVCVEIWGATGTDQVRVWLPNTCLLFFLEIETLILTDTTWIEEYTFQSAFQLNANIRQNSEQKYEQKFCVHLNVLKGKKPAFLLLSNLCC